ncbi:MAG TPA: hypothetical protein VFD82_13145 [Planctomycetota bacterium]|nr:hypothetical protein [Planctomycetota bacterium]
MPRTAQGLLLVAGHPAGPGVDAVVRTRALTRKCVYYRESWTQRPR